MKCEGLPSGKPCPDNASGNNVYFRYAALDLCSPCEKEHRKANMLANEGKASSKADNGSLNKSASQRNNSIRGTSKGALQTHSHDDIVRPKTTSVCSEKLIIDPVLSCVCLSCFAIEKLDKVQKLPTVVIMPCTLILFLIHILRN